MRETERGFRYTRVGFQASMADGVCLTRKHSLSRDMKITDVPLVRNLLPAPVA